MTKTLHRIPEQGQITGLSAGLAEYFTTDTLLVRILWVAAAIITNAPAVLFVYFIAAFIVPTKSGTKGSVSTNFTEYATAFTKDVSEAFSRSNIRISLGVVVISIGVYLFIRSIQPELFNIRWDIVWPVVLVLTGVAILARKGKQS